MGILKATEISTVKLYHGKCNVREDQVFPSAFVRVRIILASGVLGRQGRLRTHPAIVIVPLFRLHMPFFALAREQSVHTASFLR